MKGGKKEMFKIFKEALSIDSKKKGKIYDVAAARNGKKEIFTVLQLREMGKGNIFTVCWGLEIHRQQQQGILPSQHSQLARDCLVWGIRPVCSPATVGQSNKNKGFTGCGPVHRVYFCIFYLSMICICLLNHTG